MSSLDITIRLVADTSAFEKALERIIEIIGLPEEDPDNG